MRNAPRFFAKEVNTYAVKFKMFQHETYHVFASKTERDVWVSEDDYKTRFDMNGRVAVTPSEGRAQYGFAPDEDIVFHFDVRAKEAA